MSKYNTGRDGTATPDALRNAYIAGMQHGITYGAIMAMTPDAKDAAGYRAASIARRRAAADAVAARRNRPVHPFWPDVMPGGWPLPPTLPSDDPADWWPEADGWPTPPPALRGPAA